MQDNSPIPVPNHTNDLSKDISQRNRSQEKHHPQLHTNHSAEIQESLYDNKRVSMSDIDATDAAVPNKGRVRLRSAIPARTGVPH